MLSKRITSPLVQKSFFSKSHNKSGEIYKNLPPMYLIDNYPLTEVDPNDEKTKATLENHKKWVQFVVTKLQKQGYNISLLNSDIGDKATQLAKVNKSGASEQFRGERIEKITKAAVTILFYPPISQSRYFELGARYLAEAILKKTQKHFFPLASEEQIERYKNDLLKSDNVVVDSCLAPSLHVLYMLDSLSKTTLTKEMHNYCYMMETSSSGNFKNAVGFPAIKVVSPTKKAFQDSLEGIIKDHYLNKWVPHFTSKQSIERELVNFAHLEHELEVDARRCSKR